MLAPVKLLPDMASQEVRAGMLPQGTKSKQENPMSARRKQYECWLQKLREFAINLPPGQETSESYTENKNFRLSELLKFVMAELEHKLALDDFNTQSSELTFWASVQAMARKCGVNSCDFEKLSCSSAFEDATHPSGNGIPGLVDQRHDALWGELPTCSSVGYPSMATTEVFQEFPLAIAKTEAFTTTNSASFGQLAFPEYQRRVLPSFSVKHPGQGLQFKNTGPESLGFFTSKATSIRNSSASLFVPTGTPLKRKSTQGLSVYPDSRNDLSDFPAKLPEACRRRIPRHRKRAMSYNHLSANFGASASSVVWNTNIVGASDVQFLLEKELKPSDVGSLGRIILPKRQAEEKLPHLEVKEGLPMFFQDMQTSQIWELRFRFWPNNKTRMYLLESTGNFVKSHHLQQGDFILLYKNLVTGTYMIDGKKASWPKCLGMNEQKGIPVPCETGGRDKKSSFEPVEVGATTSAPAGTETATQQQRIIKDERGSSIIDEETDLLACDMWDIEDPDELIKGFSEIEAEGRSIEELFDLEK